MATYFTACDAFQKRNLNGESRSHPKLSILPVRFHKNNICDLLNRSTKAFPPISHIVWLSKMVMYEKFCIQCEPKTGIKMMKRVIPDRKVVVSNFYQSKGDVALKRVKREDKV